MVSTQWGELNFNGYGKSKGEKNTSKIGEN